MQVPSLTLDDAKSVAQERETDLAEYVPSDAVASIEQRPYGALLSCDSERGYQWSGRTDGSYKRESLIDPQALVDSGMSPSKQCRHACHCAPSETPRSTRRAPTWPASSSPMSSCRPLKRDVSPGEDVETVSMAAALAHRKTPGGAETHPDARRRLLAAR